MNLQKLFDTQKVLRDRIGYNGEDRFEKLILALLVEIGECANEWRGFKFWSKNQEPRTRKWIGMEYKDNEFGGLDPILGTDKYSNPLLEEYVDGFHFVLELGIELNKEDVVIYQMDEPDIIEEQFLEVFEYAVNISSRYHVGLPIKSSYEDLINEYLLLGKVLGFTWEEIEAAYYSKNQVNHERQSNGY